MSIDTVRAGLGDRGYDIRIGPGLTAEAGRYLRELAPVARVFVVTDENVFAAHGEALRQGLSAAGLTSVDVVLPPGEAAKSFARLEYLCGALLESRIERTDLILAFGGGVIGDLAGFAAAIVKRGLDFVQIPTTLLAQVDSSVGGKTAINMPHGKNMVGAFHQPRLVLADTSVLTTLPRRELLSGFAEVVKYGLLGDAGFYAWLEQNAAAVIDSDGPARQAAILRSVAAKARIVEIDERETGIRALLNLGHTFGHALEAETGFGDRLLHGESVAIGMVMAFQLSEKIGLCAPQTAARVAGFLRRVGLPASPRDIEGLSATPERMIAHMAHDKKAKSGRLTLILARRIGEAFATQDAADSALHAVWAEALAQ